MRPAPLSRALLAFSNDDNPRPILDPLDRNAEILFGLFMCLTFTGTIGVATAGREDVRTMMIAAIGCNAAWGLVDGIMFILRSLVTRGHRMSVARAVRAAGDPVLGLALISGELEPRFARALGDDALAHWRHHGPAGCHHRISHHRAWRIANLSGRIA